MGKFATISAACNPASDCEQACKCGIDDLQKAVCLPVVFSYGFIIFVCEVEGGLPIVVSIVFVLQQMHKGLKTPANRPNTTIIHINGMTDQGVGHQHLPH